MRYYKNILTGGFVEGIEELGDGGGDLESSE